VYKHLTNKVKQTKPGRDKATLTFEGLVQKLRILPLLIEQIRLTLNPSDQTGWASVLFVIESMSKMLAECSTIQPSPIFTTYFYDTIGLTQRPLTLR